MLKLDLAAIFSGATPIDDALLADSVLVQYRPMWLREGEDQFAPAGGTIADIIRGLVAEGHIPAEVGALGSVYLAGPVIHQENWHKVRPKADAVLFLSIVPEGGDNTFALIAGIAVAAFAIAISGGALATLAPAIFGSVGGVAGPLAFLGSGVGGSSQFSAGAS
jgi:hypothetical protein